jgi:hypothetical protein
MWDETAQPRLHCDIGSFVISDAGTVLGDYSRILTHRQPGNTWLIQLLASDDAVASCLIDMRRTARADLRLNELDR